MLSQALLHVSMLLVIHQGYGLPARMESTGSVCNARSANCYPQMFPFTR